MASELTSGALTRMGVASAVCAAATIAVTGVDAAGAVTAGALGPLAAAVVSWLIVERVHERAPARVSGVMIKLFAGKLLFFAAYVAAAILLKRSAAVVFVASFTVQYAMLHFIEALSLRRLFLADQGPVPVS